MSKEQAELVKQLENIRSKEYNNIRAAVIDEAFDYEDIVNFFTDLLKHGCISGMVGSLIYYTDTHKFYDTHYDEIEELRNRLEEDFGESLKSGGDLKNWYAWLAFEETARAIASELEIEW